MNSGFDSDLLFRSMIRAMPIIVGFILLLCMPFFYFFGFYVEFNIIILVLIVNLLLNILVLANAHPKP